MPVSANALALLDRIEALEMRSLAWGYTDGGLSEEDAYGLVGGGDAAEEAFEELLDGRLISEQSSLGGARRYRSRFAEAVRLVAANRQLFPKRAWQAAPRLVADFRVDRRPRRFPRRDRAPSDVLQDHPAIASTALRRALWQALTDAPGLHLAAFQERAAFRLTAPIVDGGTIVTAGTGSGKTIAFYLPAMLAIGEAIGPEYWVKALAIYPRIELLKDQFAEAFRMARAIDGSLAAGGQRPVRIGALFGATPRQASAYELQSHRWVRRGRDFACPWMRCPACDAEMLWRRADLDAQRERLVCASPGCGVEADERHLVLTRKRIQQQPPDILFTTTEILNQRLSDHWTRGVFGVGVQRKPFLVLLDEVHTYEGTSGAQAALTLRRWRHLSRAQVHWVGLSATLGDAARFFSDLTGAPSELVEEITPAATEFIESGAEYQIVLRGDPGARASLLSTTIQTSMLLARVLDPPGATDRTGEFGRRAFLFTDDLDVTNRLFDDLRDAEAYSIFGQPDERRAPLASLRAAGDDDRARDREGQRWRVCEDIGHPLERRLVIGRTTSQDAGVAPDANLVVATAALEVGFNDPHVGAVIQHKAPRGMASFLQRKGRAGRNRTMRPITATILSDYGRDRALYQSYERLFDPELAPQFLPIANPYVLKMQATFALFDWLAAEANGYEKAWAWDYLSRPLDSPNASVQAVLTRVRTTLGALVQGDAPTIAKLTQHLVGALGVDAETAQSLLWEPPRSLLLEAVPTLVRRLFRGWRLAFPHAGGALDLLEEFRPLPDFVPRTLFSDLSLPEVRILVPPATVKHEWRTEAMPVLQALQQLVPGRVTRRFAFERGALSHWIAVDPHSPEQERRIGEYAEEHEFVGEFTGSFNNTDDADPILVFRPWTVRLATVGRKEALPSSNARLVWRTDILARGDALSVPVAPRSPWRPFVSTVDFYLHRFRASAGVRRFAPRAEATVRTLQSDSNVQVHFRSDDGRPAAIGFELEVDGVRLDLKLPQDQLQVSALSPALLRDCKLNYLRERFRNDPALPSDFNSFQRDWIFELLCAALAAEVGTGVTLDSAIGNLLDDARIEAVFGDAMTAFFGEVGPQQHTEPGENEEGQDELEELIGDEGEPFDTASDEMPVLRTTRAAGRLHRDLMVHLARAEIRSSLRAVAAEFALPDPEHFDRWLRALVLETLGQAMLQACMAAAPRHSTIDNLLVDIREAEDGGLATIWITETTLGGAGALQAFAECFAAEPGIFFDAVEAALAPTDLELVDDGLRRVIGLACSDPDIAEGFVRLRGTDSHTDRASLWRELSSKLSARGGIDLSHALVVALNSRVLRAGSGPALDDLLCALTAFWVEQEERLTVALGLREFAYLVTRDPQWNARVTAYLASSLPPAAAANVGVFAAVFSMLWQRAADVRRTGLQSYNPYRAPRAADPAVVRQLLLRRTVREVLLGQAGWREAMHAAFLQEGACRLVAEGPEMHSVRRALVVLAATPVDVGVLQFFPAIDRIERADGRITVDLVLREHS